MTAGRAPDVAGDSIAFAFLAGRHFRRVESESTVGNELSTAGPMLFMQLDHSAILRKEGP